MDPCTRPLDATEEGRWCRWKSSELKMGRKVTVVVAEVDEEDAAVVAEAEHPAGEPDGLARVGGAELVAGMGAVRMHDWNCPSLGEYGCVLYQISPRGVTLRDCSTGLTGFTGV